MDMTNKIDIVRKVLAQCELDESSNETFEDKLRRSRMFDLFRKYTGRTPEFNGKHFNNALKLHTLEQANEANESPVSQMRLDSAQLRLILNKFYLESGQIPSKNNILRFRKENKISSKAQPKGFIWKRLPGLRKGIIIEDPERVSKRIHYLIKMRQVRISERHIIYIGKNSSKFSTYSSASKQRFQLLLAVSSKLGLLGTYFRTDYSYKLFQSFLIGVLSKVENNCVLVLEDDNLQPLPTVGSTKSEMSHWLEDNDIPHDPKAHRSELFKLIEKMGSTLTTKSPADLFISGLGHEAVIRPKDVPELDFFNHFWKESINESSTYNYKYNKITCADNIELSKWKTYEMNLIVEENTMYKNDLLMEEIIDSLFTVAKKGLLTEYAPGLMEYQNFASICNDLIIR